jgi:hypothetical protein
MKTEEIVPAAWFDRLSRLSKERDGALSTLRILSKGFGAQVEARNLPLEGIVSPRSGAGPIVITLGRGVDTHIEHNVSDGVRVWAQFDDDGREVAIEIESRDGTKTILELPFAKPTTG